jgi:hypothetical protein
LYYRDKVVGVFVRFRAPLHLVAKALGESVRIPPCASGLTATCRVSVCRCPWDVCRWWRHTCGGVRCGPTVSMGAAVNPPAPPLVALSALGEGILVPSWFYSWGLGEAQEDLGVVALPSSCFFTLWFALKWTDLVPRLESTVLTEPLCVNFKAICVNSSS